MFKSIPFVANLCRGSGTGLGSGISSGIYRIGQMRAVRVRYLRADHFIDKLVFDVLDIKKQLIARVVDSAATTEGLA